MPSYPEGSMNINSGVGDNAAGKYFAGSQRSGGNMFRNNRQMKAYMQMRRDEMSHGAFLANQNAALDFNRESSRIDSNVQQQDWSRGRASEHLSDYGAKNPHAVSADLDNAKASWNPAFAPAGSPTPPPGGVGGPAKPKNPRGKNATTGDVEKAVRAGHITPEEATGFDSKTGLSPTYSKKFAANAAANGGVSKGRQFTGPTPSPVGSAVGTPVKSGNELDEVTGPKNTAGNGRTDLPTKFF